MAITVSGTTITFNDATTQTVGFTNPIPVANGGTGATTLTANNVILGNGTSVVQVVAPGSNGNILTSNGSTWTSAAPAGGGVTSLNGQTGAITNTTIDNIGCSVNVYVGLSSPVPNAGDGSEYGNTNYTVGSTIAGSSLRYNMTFTTNSLSRNYVLAQTYVRQLGDGSGRVAVGYLAGGTALTGSYRFTAPARITSQFLSDPNTSTATWHMGIAVRIS